MFCVEVIAPDDLGTPEYQAALVSLLGTRPEYVRGPQPFQLTMRWWFRSREDADAARDRAAALQPPRPLAGEVTFDVVSDEAA